MDSVLLSWQIYNDGHSDALFWNRYVANVMSDDEVKNYQAHKSGTMKLQPFYDHMMADLAFLFYQKLTNEIPHDYKALVRLPIVVGLLPS